MANKISGSFIQVPSPVVNAIGYINPISTLLIANYQLPTDYSLVVNANYDIGDNFDLELSDNSSFEIT